MELKEFIKAAISDITGAISELQEELDNGTIVSPSLPDPISLKTIKHEGMNRLISKIDFDVAITVGDTNKFEGGAKAGIQIFSAKMEGGNEKHTENVSRMTFSIPVMYPSKHVKDEDIESNAESNNKIRRQLHSLHEKARNED